MFRLIQFVLLGSFLTAAWRSKYEEKIEFLASVRGVVSVRLILILYHLFHLVRAWRVRGEDQVPGLSGLCGFA